MKVKPYELKVVTVKVTSTFHPEMHDEYRVKVDEWNVVKPKYICHDNGCQCGYPLGSHTNWEVVGYPDWPVECDETSDGQMIRVLVPGRGNWFRCGKYRGLSEWWDEDTLINDESGTASLEAFGFDGHTQRQMCEEAHVPEFFREDYLYGLLIGLKEAWKAAREELARRQ